MCIVSELDPLTVFYLPFKFDFVFPVLSVFQGSPILLFRPKVPECHVWADLDRDSVVDGR